MPPHPCIPLFVAFVIAVCSSVAEGQVRVTGKEGGFEFTDGDLPVLFYQRTAKSRDGKYERSGYVHPLYDLDGDVLTEDFPSDHLHHRGIFWAWHQLTVGGKQIGDPWEAKRFLQHADRVTLAHCPDRTAAMTAELAWLSPDWVDEAGEQKPIVREVATIRVHPVRDNRRSIDFRIALTALEKDVRIGGSNDDKGYGGFSPRIRLPDGLRFLSTNGEVEPTRLSVDPSPWLDFSGSFRKGSTSGMTVLCHPTVPGFPQRWILRRRGSMQNPVFPGRHSVPLPTDKALEFRYRLVLHRGAPEADTIDGWFKTYAGEVSASR